MSSSRGPISPAEYGEGMNNEELTAEGWAAGLDVWGPVKKGYGNFVGDDTLANSQLWSLREAIRREYFAELRDLIDNLTDSGDCSFDHDGGCEAHGYLSLEPGEKCPQQKAKELLAAHEADAGGAGQVGGRR